jgi:two-component system OmpR family response regulator
MRQETAQWRDDHYTQSAQYQHRVLIFDEDLQDLTRHATPFEDQGFEVHKCASLEAALRAIERENFQLALVDQGFPTREGFRVVRHLIRYSPYTPFLMLTRHNDMKAYLEALDMGAADYLEKPVPHKQLNELIRCHLLAPVKKV